MKTELTKDLYDMALVRIEVLLPLVSDETPLSDPNSVELCLMSDIVEESEKIHFPISKPLFHEVIKLRLEEENMKKMDLAQKIGVSPSRISEYISGKSEPTLKIARLICQALKINGNVALGL